MRVLVTGGAGFVGSNLVDALLAEGHSVRILDNFNSGKRSNLPSSPNLEVMEGSIADPFMSNACEGMEHVFHLAAIASVQKSIEQPEETQRAGEIGTLNMLQAAVKYKVKRFVLAASASAYGNTGSKPATERMVPKPLSPYAASKLACEGYVRAFAQSMGMDGVSLRYFNIFGPRQDPKSPYSGVVSIFSDKMRAGERPTIFGDGTQCRDFTYIDNVVQANLITLKYPNPLKGNVFNIGCGTGISLNMLSSVLGNILKTDIQPSYGPERQGDIQYSCADISKARSILGYEPTVDFASGLRKMLLH